MIKKYIQNTATHNYIFGVCRQGRVTAYFVEGLTENEYRLIFNEKPTTAKRQTVIKFRSTASKVDFFKVRATRTIEMGTQEELQAQRRTRINRQGKPYIENCGDCFEYLMAQTLQVAQNASANLSHTQGGDLNWNGKAWQVKYEKSGIAVG